MAFYFPNKIYRGIVQIEFFNFIFVCKNKYIYKQRCVERGKHTIILFK
jgi:hypothetical protein